jgi:hypothetical protein
MKRVTVHIDRLVLRGLPDADGEGIAEGIEQELGRVLADPEAVRQLTSSGDTPRLRTSARLEAGSHPLLIGAQVARAIGKGLKP